MTRSIFAALHHVMLTAGVTPPVSTSPIEAEYLELYAKAEVKKLPPQL